MSSFDILSKSTPLQRRLFLEASAGTGKTFTIEHLVVRLLLETDFTLEQILIVTFTRAATRELKVRIRANLEKILSGSETLVSDCINPCPFDRVKASQLRDRERGSIKPIQPLSRSRNFESFDAGPMDRDLCNQTPDYLSGLSDAQKEKIKTALLTFEQAQIFTIHGFCHRILQEFAFEAFVGLELQEWEEQEEKWAVLEFLRTADCLYPEQLKRLLGFFRSDIEKLIGKLISSSEVKTMPSCTELLEKANQNLSQIPFFAIVEVFAEIRVHYKGMISDEFESQAKLIQEALSRGKFLPEEWDCLIGEEELFLEKIEASNLKMRTKFTGHAPMNKLRAALLLPLEAARNPRKIMQLLAKAWQEERKKLSRLHEKVSPDDLLKMVQERIGEPSFVAEIRKKYQAVIVDEFQDTDPVQWKIFETLFFTDRSKSIYLVGDPKQSIYAFREADIYTFLEAAKGFDSEQKAMLTTNYRSTSGLLDSLNRLMCNNPWLDLPKLQQTLAVPLSKAAKTGEGELCFMIAEGKAGKKWPSSEVEQQFFSYIVHEIHQKNLEPKQIAVLVKDRYQALRVKNFLEPWKIPCVLTRGASLGDSLMVDLLEELIDACHSDEPQSPIKKVLLGPFICLPIKELTDEAVFEAKGIFAELAKTWLKVGFAAFLSRFLQTRFWKTTVLQTLDETLYDDLMQIVEKILYIQDPHQMIKALRLVKVQETDERISAHPHGIQIMTTHASKGLEFETVFALGLASRTIAEDRPEEQLKELDAEKMRQVYVALTRAKRRLYIPIAKELSEKVCNSGEASPVELFLERVSPDLSTFTSVQLSQVSFDLRPFTELQEAALVPPPSRAVFFKPFFLQSFTSLAQPFGERKPLQDQLLPAGSETGIILHRIFERLFDHAVDPSHGISALIFQEVKGSHLEGHESLIQKMIDNTLDLPLDGFTLRGLDLAKVMPEMEFLFPTGDSSLKGFIDLSFEHNKKFYLIDWKTNVLENYTPAALEETMIQNDYLLQGKIYTTALTRYLKLYGDLQFGGVFFLFVRGPAAYHFIPEAFDV
jgi:exodeoxyribonuclease V beta subunit